MNPAGSGKQEAGSRRPANQGKRTGFRRLIAWEKADDLAVAVYLSLKPIQGLDPWRRSQATRAAFSIPSNIAEGYARGSLGDYLHFLDFARGSLAELDYPLHFMRRVELIPAAASTDLEARLKESGRVLQGIVEESQTEKPGSMGSHSRARRKRRSIWWRMGASNDRRFGCFLLPASFDESA